MPVPGRDVLVGEELFATQKAAIEHCQRILYSYEEGSPVTDPEHLAFLASLLGLHPEAVEKVGAGVAGFEVHKNLKTPGFWVVRADGTKLDFSFYKCIRAPSHGGTVRAAMRREVVDQVLHAKDAAFALTDELPCPVTGEAITRKTCHVDHHDPTFVQLADDFAAHEGGYEHIKVAAQASRIGSRLADDDVATRWRKYHGERAHLRMVSLKANLSILTRANPP